MTICKGPRSGPFAYRRRPSLSGRGDLAGVGIDDFGGGLVLLRPGGGAATASGFFEAITVAIHGQDADVMG